jgi:predicted MFS family arabinose efflux permease
MIMQKNHYTNTASLEKQQFSNYLPWVIWFLATLFYMYENVIQVSPGVMVPDLMKAFSINSAALGSTIAFFFYSYASMQIPVGILVDNYNARTLLTLAAVSCALGCVLFGLADNLAMIAAGRFLIGFGAAFACVCAMKLASNWFPAKQFTLLVGLMVTVGMLGSMMGERPLALLVDNIGWRQAMLLLSAIGILLALLIALIVRHSPNDLKARNKQSVEKPARKEKSLLKGLSHVLTSGQSWILAIYGGLMFASTSIFGGLWGVPFLMKAYALDKPTAAGIVSLLFFGWVVGSPLSGMLTNALNSYKKILWISSIGGLSVMLAILYIPQLSIWVLSLLVFCFGVFSSFFLPSFTLMRDLHSDDCSGVALGFMNSANMLGGAFGQPLIGILLDATWDGTLINTVRIYSVQHYQYALSCLPIMMFLSLVLLPFIKEKRT